MQQTGALPEMISPYMRALIEKTGGPEGPIGLQFIQRDSSLDEEDHTDPLIEGIHEEAPGIVYKYRGQLNNKGDVEYHGRVLWLISRFCATYCRFCTRGRMVGVPTDKSVPGGETLAQKPYLDVDDIEAVVAFIRAHPEINEVILSGGDPMIAPKPYLEMIFNTLALLQESGSIDFVRIHTRAPITNPFTIRPWHLELLKKIRLPHMVLHINHPAEITDEVKQLVLLIQKETDTVLLSQSVLLKGVNDNVTTLYSLFTELAKIGIRPYYLHHNDPVSWAKDFTVPIKDSIQIWQTLRQRLSGIASTAKFVIDTPYGVGKVPIPDGRWEEDYSVFYDFNNVKHRMR
jgi:lysine 2,3-aminomutase